MEVDVGHRPSFGEAGVNVAASLSLNERQSLALQMVCRKLDEVREDEANTEQLLLFIGGEGGTGKSRVIEALAAVFNELDESHRLLVTATSGTAAANIDGITIHSACHLSQNKNRRQPATLDNFGATAAQTSRMDGEVKAEWRNRWLLVLDEVRAAADIRLQQLLHRIRAGQQNAEDVDLLNTECYRPQATIPWETGITVVTPLNRNRWNLNMEATLHFQRQHDARLHIFTAEHTWPDDNPTEEEAVLILSQGDESTTSVPAVFLFVPGMPIIVNQNIHQSLKLVNGAPYTAVDVIVDPRYPA
ncbi:hypothetical protein CPLU01_16143, partial [Colletotrichum plurivorum]